MKKSMSLLIALVLIGTVIAADGDYGSGLYGDGDYGTGTVTPPPAPAPSSSGGGGGGRRSSYVPGIINAKNIKAGEGFRLKIATGISVKHIDIFATEDIAAAKFSVKQVSYTPKGNPEGKVFAYLSISANGLSDKLEKAEINFEIKRDWIEENEFTEKNIVLQRYNNGKWENLPTEYITDGQYRATTPGFSYFAITALEDFENENLLVDTNEESIDFDPIRGGLNSKEESEEVVIAPDETEEVKKFPAWAKWLIVIAVIVAIIAFIVCYKSDKKKKEQEKP